MRIYAISDIHADYSENRTWINNLSKFEYTDDIIIIAGDISDDLYLLEKTLIAFKKRFHKVFFLPGNHDLWIRRDKKKDSMEKFFNVLQIADSCGIYINPWTCGKVSIVPLYSWYDYTFGKPHNDLMACWSDFFYCCWPEGYSIEIICQKFLLMNTDSLKTANEFIISYSHFLPSLNLIKANEFGSKYFFNPVLGSAFLMEQIKKLGSKIHVYGHSHINLCKKMDGILYVNNAYGYPYESHIASKKIQCIFSF